MSIKFRAKNKLFRANRPESRLSPIFKQLDEFLAPSNKLSSKWLESKHMQVYVRKGPRSVEGDFHEFITIANIVVFQSFQNKRYWKTFMQYVKTKGMPIYIENANNPIVSGAAIRWGFKLNLNSHCSYYTLQVADVLNP
jgi:hypothetical protein